LTAEGPAPEYGVVMIACEGYFVTKSLEVIRTTGFAVA